MEAEELSTFKLALSMRTAAPRVEAHYQFYSTAVEPSLPSEQVGCEHWILFAGQQYCSASLENAHGTVQNSSQTRALPFDRRIGAGLKDIILYADITAPSFADFHNLAHGMVSKGEGTYRIRYKRSPSHPSEALTVNGYGVELALKRTDYIVIDDRHAASEVPDDDTQKPLSSEVVLDTQEDVRDIKPLEKSELASLSLKTASYIMQSDAPFDALLQLSQDFPKFSTSLGSQNVPEAFEAELAAMTAQIPAGMNVWFMNGLQLIDRQVQPFSLIDILQRERKLIHGVREMGLSGHEAVSLFGHSEVLQSKSDNTEPLRFDWRDETEGGKVIIWLNDLEKDKRYADFSSSLYALLQSMGGLPRVRRDIFNLVVPVDFSKADDLDLVLNKIFVFMNNLVPVRFGLVPLTDTPESAEEAKVVYYVLENYGLQAMSNYLQEGFKSKKSGKADEGVFKKAVKDVSLREGATALPFKEIFASEQQETHVELARHWVHRLHAHGSVPSVFFNGQPFLRDNDWVGNMNQKLGRDLQQIQRAVYFGQVAEDMWIPGFFIEGAATRRNVFIHPENPQDLTFLDVHKVYTEHKELFGNIPVIEADEHAQRGEWAALTVITDLDSAEGRKLLFNALEFRRENNSVRVDIVHNPADATWSGGMMNARIKLRQDNLLGAAGLLDLEAIVSGDRAEADAEWDAALASFLHKANMKTGENWLMLNGRVVGPIPLGDDFKKEDYQQLLGVEEEKRSLPVQIALEDLGLGDRLASPLDLAKLTSVTALSGISDLPKGIFESAPTARTTLYNVWNATLTSFSVGEASTATIFLVAILNPASELGQKWAPILKVLSELEGVHLQVFLNPARELSELPVKRFYRHVLSSAPSFDENGKVQALSANFSGIPSETLLIAGMDVPPAWLVSSKVSVDDLDNLRIKDVKARRNTETIEAIYELEHILIEGHSREQPHGLAPRGAQLVLGTESNQHITDTIIMANLGFFQFKANPGVYNITLREGRSSEIFEIESVGPSGWSPVPGDATTEIALMDFQGATLYPRLVRRPGMEEEDVLEEGSVLGSALDFVKSGFKFAEGLLGVGSTAKSQSDMEHAEINIFSVASGHLYERMLNIMMVSVMRHTNHTVKFWFIEQFLSPSFKDFIPTMAAEYGFKYEMVAYKWPHWLRQQKEKQREIWGYKILFLDVLFPLSLDKVIFVDADQIVRTDMYDLVRLDLQGAPYGFTPMCDSRTEMEGFRFWKTGYWATYLKGHPYHISALYVVDLRRFREMAAGDRLRQQYHALSADPGSLSNLDQDLPNHMQFVIPIHSLPQEWLWCETWCSDETLAEARTIDLCNNPLTKEPKLDRARRQVAEWNVYDEEIAALAKRRRAAKNGAAGEGEEAQKVSKGAHAGGATGGAEPAAEAVEKNPKSRRLDDEGVAAQAEETHVMDEL